MTLAFRLSVCRGMRFTCHSESTIANLVGPQTLFLSKCLCQKSTPRSTLQLLGGRLSTTQWSLGDFQATDVTTNTPVVADVSVSHKKVFKNAFKPCIGGTSLTDCLITWQSSQALNTLGNPAPSRETSERRC